MHLGFLSKKETESPYFSRKQGSSKNEFNAIKLINNFNVICCFSRTLSSKLLLLFCKMKVPHQDQQCKSTDTLLHSILGVTEMNLQNAYACYQVFH